MADILYRDWVRWAREQRQAKYRQQRKLQRLKNLGQERVAEIGERGRRAASAADIEVARLAYGPESIRAKELALDRELLRRELEKPLLPPEATPVRKTTIPSLEGYTGFFPEGRAPSPPKRAPAPALRDVTLARRRRSASSIPYMPLSSSREQTVRSIERLLVGKNRRLKPYVGGFLRMVTAPPHEIFYRMARIGATRLGEALRNLRELISEEY